VNNHNDQCLCADCMSAKLNPQYPSVQLGPDPEDIAAEPLTPIEEGQVTRRKRKRSR